MGVRALVDLLLARMTRKQTVDELEEEETAVDGVNSKCVSR
jgi:hypothetical protein